MTHKTQAADSACALLCMHAYVHGDARCTCNGSTRLWSGSASPLITLPFPTMSTGPPLRTDVETEDDKSRESVLEHGVVTSNDSALDIPEASSCKSRVWWKLDLLVLPIVGILSCLTCLVRHDPFLHMLLNPMTTALQDLANVGNAKIAGLQQKLGISDEQVRFPACPLKIA